jgi:hypothetical protein
MACPELSGLTHVAFGISRSWNANKHQVYSTGALRYDNAGQWNFLQYGDFSTTAT